MASARVLMTRPGIPLGVLDTAVSGPQGVRVTLSDGSPAGVGIPQTAFSNTTRTTFPFNGGFFAPFEQEIVANADADAQAILNKYMNLYGTVTGGLSPEAAANLRAVMTTFVTAYQSYHG